MNKELKFQESLRRSITTPVVILVQTFVMRTGTSVEASGFSAELGLFQEKSFGSVCTAAFLVLALKYGVYKISYFFERGSTNIHFPAGVAICRAFLTSGSGS